MDIKKYWKTRQKLVDNSLSRYIPKETTRSVLLHRAMRYSIFAGGKRLRPLLALAGAEVVSKEHKNAVASACAVECIHTYSLIHDDLPCMDNDDLRRGKPTNHKVFGDNIAVLAGDALLTLAFEIVAFTKPTKRYSLADMFKELAVASGSRSLVGGQVTDIQSEGKKITFPELRYIHEKKTAALITTSLRLGAMSANATPTQLSALTKFGRNIGLSFQVIDDLLDVTQTKKKLGKSAGKDLKSKKATYPSLLGIERTKKEAQKLTEQALKALEPLGKKADVLKEIANYLVDRDY